MTSHALSASPSFSFRKPATDASTVDQMRLDCRPKLFIMTSQSKYGVGPLTKKADGGTSLTSRKAVSVIPLAVQGRIL
jgi:hypothetical protein